MSSEHQEEPGPFAPGPVAPLAGAEGRVLLDENGEPVLIPVTPPDDASAVLPPGTIRRTAHNPDGSVTEHITITYD
jgi:hypothetical protein